MSSPMHVDSYSLPVTITLCLPTLNAVPVCQIVNDEPAVIFLTAQSVASNACSRSIFAYIAHCFGCLTWLCRL